jgi:hydroxymethylpyrimidine/phosphomethylpyrimidine kinase
VIENMSSRPSVLIIAGSDSSGGAGVLRDVQVLTQFAVDARCAVTAVTAQTDTHVAAVHYLPPQLIRQQIGSALETGEIAAVKIGMLGTCAIVQAVAESLPARDRVPIVLDPVLTSSSGKALLEAAALNALRELLMPRVTLITPNLPEAAVLLGEEVATSEPAIFDQAQRLLRFDVRAVLMKGGHAAGEESVDVLVTRSDPPIFLRAARKRATLRGTGCALSSAIAAGLALKNPLVVACERAKAYVWNQLQNDNAAVR